MNEKYLITVAYDGTDFFGWQRQAKGRTVQEELEKALSALFKCETSCLGGSRTDSGVHALAQKVVFWADTTIPTQKLPLAIAPFLPKDICVIDAQKVHPDFNPRFAPKSKTYEYWIWNCSARNPLLRNYSEFVPEKLDIELMREAAKHFIGTHDFNAFCASGSSAKSTVRTIYSLDIIQRGHKIIIKVCGNAFLYNMVRIIAGTLIYVGTKKISPSKIPEIILSKKRELAGKTAGPHGLCLTEVDYEA